MKITVLLFIAALGLGGCVTSVTSIPPDYSLGAKEESIVIGRVNVEVWGKPNEFLDRLTSIALFVRQEATGKDFVIRCDQGGSDADFYVSLPYGDYRMLRVEKGNSIFTASDRFRFEVLKGQVLYLGTRKFVYEGKGIGDVIRDAFVGLGSLPLKSSVVDEYDRTAKSFREKYPHISQPIVRSAMLRGARPESLVISFDKQNWQIGNTSDKEGQILIEYFRPGETVQNWSERVTKLSFLGGLERMTALQLFERQRERIVSKCPTVKWVDLRKEPTQILYEWQSTDCPGLDNQYLVAKVIQSATSLHTAFYENRRLPISDELRAEWTGTIGKVTVEAMP